MNSVLLDTSFLITFADPNRPHHEIANQYFFECAKRGIPMFLSTIVISEFSVVQPITDLPLGNFHVLPFNVDHAIHCGRLIAEFPRDKGDDRVKVKDDFKIIAQCDLDGVTHLFTEDDSTLVKYLKRVNPTSFPTTSSVLMKDGFDRSHFDGGQRSF